ncbi:hypothetical protein HK096_011283, partial [Nowakowskiella sp. JEL0078]
MAVKFPGDPVEVDEALEDGMEVDEKETVTIGPGLFKLQDQVIAIKAGLLCRIEKENKWFIDSSQKRYVAVSGESVLGIVIGSTTKM